MLTICTLGLAIFLAPGPGVEELFKADRAFSTLAAQNGPRAAFLEYLAPGAIIFRPGPVDAISFYKSQTGPEGKLQWEPIRGDVSKAQDLGYTTGPWQMTTSSGGKDSVLDGYYVSIWKKQADGRWLIVLDAGVPTPKEDSAASARAGTAPSPPTRGSLAPSLAPAIQVPMTDDLAQLDAALGEATILYGALAAYQAFSADDVRIYRPNELPLPGRERLSALIGSRKLEFKNLGSDLASSRDLGYTYGITEIIGGADGQGNKYFAHLHVWSKKDDRWSLALDLRTPVTAEVAEKAKREQ